MKDKEERPEGPEPPKPETKAEGSKPEGKPEGEGKSTGGITKRKEAEQFVDVQGIIPRLRVRIKLGHNVAFRGRTGTGKTFLISKLAQEQEKRLVVLNMTVNTTTDEIKGHYGPAPAGSGGQGLTVKWVEGALAKAMKNGYWVVIEEANFMRDEVASALYSPMDHRRDLVIDEHEGEVIKAHPDFRLFLTMNWDYSGTQRFNPAIMNRINSWFDVDYLPPNQEAALIVQTTGIPRDVADKMCLFARKVRSASMKENLPDLSTRILLDWGEVIKAGESPEDAAETSVIPILGYTEDEKAMPRELLATIFGSKKYEDD